MTVDINPYESTETECAVVADVAERATIAENSVEPVDLGGGRTLVRTLRREGVVEDFIDPDRYADRPRAKTGTVHPLTVPSLIAYVQKHKGSGTEVWVVPDKGRFEAVIDDHRPDSNVLPAEVMQELTEDQAKVWQIADAAGASFAGWGDHRAVCELQQTRDWKHWTFRDGQLLSQLDFAEHLEAGLHNITAPPAADLLEVAQTLHGSRNVAWKSGARLSDGQVQLRYEEDLQGRAGSTGNLEIPQTFTLTLAPFEGTEAVQLTASLRWRLVDGRVSLGYRLQRPDVVLREAVDSLIDQVESELGLRALLGIPRPARTLP